MPVVAVVARFIVLLEFNQGDALVRQFDAAGENPDQLVCDVLRELAADLRPVTQDDGTQRVDCARDFPALLEHQVVRQGDDDAQDLVLAFVALEVLDGVGLDAQTLQLREEHLQDRELARVLVALDLAEVVDDDTLVLRGQLVPLAVHHAHHRLDHVQDVGVGVVVGRQTVAGNLHHHVGYELERVSARDWRRTREEIRVLETEVVNCAHERAQLEELERAHSRAVVCLADDGLLEPPELLVQILDLPVWHVEDDQVQQVCRVGQVLGLEVDLDEHAVQDALDHGPGLAHQLRVGFDGVDDVVQGVDAVGIQFLVLFVVRV